MAAAPLANRGAKLVGLAAALAMVGVIGGISFTGHWPRGTELVSEAPTGILPLPGRQVARVEISSGGNPRVFAHGSDGGWSADGAPLAPAVAQHIDNAIHFANVSPPNRVLHAGDYDAAKIAEFGLDPPRMLVSLVTADGKRHSIAFGEPTPAENSQYVRLIGEPDVYLLSRFVGVEWQVALDMAERAVPAPARSDASRPGVFLLPVSLAQVWAVEIVEHGQLTRFERDPTGLWFHHTGQHTHKFGFVHHADPRLAPLIAAELAGLERASVEAVVATHPDEAKLTEFGLEHPSAIMLLYTAASSQPVARLEFGKPAQGEFARYARVRETDSVVTVPRFAVAHIDKLLQIAGVRW